MRYCSGLFCPKIVTMLFREKERSRISTGQMESFRGLLGIRRMDRVILNVRIRERCEIPIGGMKGLMKMFSNNLNILKDLGIIVIELQKRYMWRSIREVIQRIDRGIGGNKKKKRFVT